jgi:lysozyme
MIDNKYLEAIKQFEGFAPRATWDYAQSTNGYGTRAKFDGEKIDRAEADRRFNDEIARAYKIVERFAPGLNEGCKAALTSLTFNAGPSWTTSGLGRAIQSGDLATARTIFQKYDKAAGQALAGLTSRRATEVTWFGNSHLNAPFMQVTHASAGYLGAAPTAQADAHATASANLRAQPADAHFTTDRQTDYPALTGVSFSANRDLAYILAILTSRSIDPARDDEIERSTGAGRAAVGG